MYFGNTPRILDQELKKPQKNPKQPKNNNKQKQEQKTTTRQMSKFNFNNS